jgi:FixJ family two-component response regulator
VSAAPADGIVFVVDDDDSVRRAVARLVRSVGLDVETFPSARAFLDHSLADRPSVLVLDVRLRGASGLDLQAELSRTRPDIPIIILTGHGDVPMSVRALKGGAIDFFQKPVRNQDLLDSIHGGIIRSREALAARAARDAIHRRFGTLTAREREVLTLVVAGAVNKEVASRLGISLKTVKIHRGRAMQKMQAESVAELVRLAQRAGLLVEAS